MLVAGVGRKEGDVMDRRVLAVALMLAAPVSGGATEYAEELFNSMHYRLVGPYRGGRRQPGGYGIRR